MFLIEAYWYWFVVALLAGAVVGFWADSPIVTLFSGVAGWLCWVAFAFLCVVFFYYF
jgi:hypothetical protein